MDSKLKVEAPADDQLGPPQLQDMAYRAVVSKRCYLGDIGVTPVMLIKDILQYCSVEELAHIEDKTRYGGRDIGEDLSPYWKQCLIKNFGPEALPDEAEETDEGSIDWRSFYEWRVQQEEERMQEIGQRLRFVHQQCIEKKNSRSLKVIEKIPVPRRQAKRGSARAAPPVSSRHRLLKKLGLPAPPAKKTAPRALTRPVRRVVKPAPAPQEPPKWCAEHNGTLLMESDLDIPGAPAPRPTSADSAKAALTSSRPRPAPTDNRFAHTPPFQQPHANSRQAQKPTAASNGSARPLVGHDRTCSQQSGGSLQSTAAAAQPGGCNRGTPAAAQEAAGRESPSGASSMPARGKRPAEPLTPEEPAKRRKPQVLNASALLSIAANGRRGAELGQAQSGSSSGRHMQMSGSSGRGQSGKAAVKQQGNLCPGRSQHMRTGSANAGSQSSGRNGCAILVETDIFA